MLISLVVKNFAIIDNIQIDFSDGMTVITGETGAGKSLIIDAIGLLFGNRAANDMIRFGESKAVIEGIFSHYNPDIVKILNELGVDFEEEDNLIIKRELYNTGKSICRVNNTIVSLNQLQVISEFIGDIHSQNDTIGLINPKNYLKFLNNKSINEELKNYNIYLKEYHDNEYQYQEFLKQCNENKAKEDFLRYQLNEFNNANIKVEEEEQLKAEFEYLSNFEHVTESIQEINELNQDGEILKNLYKCLANLQKLENYDKKYKDLRNILEESYYNLSDTFNSNLLKINNIDFDEKRFDQINDKLSIYSDFKRKYKKSTQEIVDYFQKIKNDINLIDNSEVYLAELKSKLDQSYIKTMNVAKNIRAKRMELCKDLTEQMKKHLHDLQLKNVNFVISFNEINEKKCFFKNDGIDEIDFLVSFNKGEPVKSLSKIASGGEMSRFMLALKTVLGDALPLQTKIFDEIDNGVSGAVAYSIAEKIKFIAKTSQVLCITHLPQVASISDHHLKIKKVIENNRTITKIEILNTQEKITEIASMISNGVPTEASINLAKELLSTSAKF